MKFQILTLILFNIYEIIICANIRLISFGCEEETISIIVWNNSDHYTQLKELCSLSVTIKGFASSQSLNNIENNYEPKAYQITVLLSFEKSPNLDLLSKVIKLDTLSLENQNETIDGFMKVSLNSISLPPVEFCGESYLIAVLQRIHGLQVLKYGFLSFPIRIECNEQYIDLGIRLSIPEIETIINFDSKQQYMKVVSTFQMINISESELSMPDKMQFSIVNNANQTFKQRCGIFSLQLISYIIPYNDSEKLPIGSDKNEFNSLLKPYGKLLQYSTNAFMINRGQNIINNKLSVCSPAIQPNDKFNIEMQFFKLNKSLTEEFSQFSQLILIIDPLSTIKDQKLDNNVFVLPLHFLNDKGLNQHDCVVESDPFSYGNEAIIIHNNHKTGVSKTYSYNSFTKSLAQKESNQSIHIMTKYFWQNWIINRRADQLLNRNECPKQLLSKPFTELFYDFLLNARLSVSRVSAKTQWQKNQIKSLYYFLKTIRDSMKQFKSGSLSFYSSQILLSFKNHFRQIGNDSILNIILMFDEFRDIILNQNPRINSTKSFVTKRIEQFLQRLSTYGVNETINTIPKLEENRNFIEELYNVLKLIRDNSLFDFDLPNQIKDMLIESINSPQINVSEVILKCMKSGEKYLKNNEINETQKDSIDLLISLLKSSLDLSVWNAWLELHDKWKQIIKSESHFILLNGKLENNQYINDEQLFCKPESLKHLLLWNAIPDWLNINYELETNPFINTIGLELRSSSNLIERSDLDPITGYKFWSIVFMCECSSAQFCNNNL